MMLMHLLVAMESTSSISGNHQMAAYVENLARLPNPFAGLQRVVTGEDVVKLFEGRHRVVTGEDVVKTRNFNQEK